MTKIKLEIETDSDKELLSATVTFKYSNGKSVIQDVITNESSNIKKLEKKSNKKSIDNDIYQDLKLMKPAEEGVDESFNIKY